LLQRPSLLGGNELLDILGAVSHEFISYITQNTERIEDFIVEFIVRHSTLILPRLFNCRAFIEMPTRRRISKMKCRSTTRKSGKLPPFDAGTCPYKLRKGKDGMYRSTDRADGVWVWKKV
jgi:hypothetical protein